MLSSSAPLRGVPLDAAGDLRFGLRTYVNARVGTRNTYRGHPPSQVPASTQRIAATFPFSAAGHLRQNRFFLEAELKHDLDRLRKAGVGPLGLLRHLPFDIDGLSYDLTFRAERDGIYDWGPSEYRTAEAFRKAAEKPPVAIRQATVDFPAERRRLREIAVHRERLFQAFVQGSLGDLFVRFGRQNLSWGETDGFRLLDQINPLDNSFGGFVVSLDERRVPLDMLRLQYGLDSLGPISEAFLEGYIAIDDEIGYIPGTPAGSPWTLPGSAPSTITRMDTEAPDRTFEDARGGARLVFNALDATFSLAHYYTYSDIPAVQLFTSGLSPAIAFDDGLPCAGEPDARSCGYVTHALATPQRMQVSGGTVTFAVPKLYAVVRSEVAYMKDEPSFEQGQLDPFVFTNPGLVKTASNTGGTRRSDSINAVIGFDVQRFIRLLNPRHTFFFSTQLFYKHVRHAGRDDVFVIKGKHPFPNPERPVLPIIEDLLPVIGMPVEPLFLTQPNDIFLNTFFVATSYRSGTINPGLVVFYDWAGAFLFQPFVAFSRDPFRFSIEYSAIEADSLRGGSGISLLRDRDNLQLKLEYAM